MTAEVDHAPTLTEPRPSPAAADTTLDEAAVQAFAEQVFGHYTGGMLTYMIDLGHRTGLFERLADGPATSEELAARGGVFERYVREWLSALATAGIVTYDPDSARFALPPEHAACLTGSGAMNLAPQSQITTLLARYVEGVADAFRDGGGIPFTAYRPDFTEVMDGLSRGVLGDLLVADMLPRVDGLVDRLTEGTTVADVGCGTGHSTNLMAQAFPTSRFVGYDLAPDALEHARAEATAWGLDNVTFEVHDARELPLDPGFGVVFAFDTIHDLVDPAGVLERINAALTPGGTFVMYDVAASSDLGENLEHPLGPFIYSVSTLHCMTVSLSEGGAGLGTGWGTQRAQAMLAEAGFIGVETHDLPDDPLNCLHVGRKPPA